MLPACLLPAADQQADGALPVCARRRRDPGVAAPAVMTAQGRRSHRCRHCRFHRRFARHTAPAPAGLPARHAAQCAPCWQWLASPAPAPPGFRRGDSWVAVLTQLLLSSATEKFHSQKMQRTLHCPINLQSATAWRPLCNTTHAPTKLERLQQKGDGRLISGPVGAGCSGSRLARRAATSGLAGLTPCCLLPPAPRTPACARPPSSAWPGIPCCSTGRPCRRSTCAA